MIAFLKACVYGVVQGLTEFLPVSSSGHLVIAKHYLGVQDSGITMEVITHAATALAAIIFMRRRIGGIVRAAYKTLTVGYRGLDDTARGDIGLLVMLVVATGPAVVAGLLLRSHVEGLFSDVSGAARMLIVTGAFVYLTGRFGGGQKPFNLPRALAVGVAQALAILPGISRSGLTVGTGLAFGVERKRAFDFALLLSIPVILGATLYEFLGGRLGGSGPLLAAAFVAAFLSGYVAISLLFSSVVKNRFYMFAYYLIPAGIVLLILQ
ncbi:MAG: undecaprenyl-diphosphate phosphatase [bacterium]|jgi:undecaprenyl-diphosphatase